MSYEYLENSLVRIWTLLSAQNRFAVCVPSTFISENRITLLLIFFPEISEMYRLLFPAEWHGCGCVRVAVEQRKLQSLVDGFQIIRGDTVWSFIDFYLSELMRLGTPCITVSFTHVALVNTLSTAHASADTTRVHAPIPHPYNSVSYITREQ